MHQGENDWDEYKPGNFFAQPPDFLVFRFSDFSSFGYNQSPHL